MSLPRQQPALLEADGEQRHPGAGQPLAIAPLSIAVDNVVESVPDSGVVDLFNPPLVLGTLERVELGVVDKSLACHASWGVRGAERLVRAPFRERDYQRYVAAIEAQGLAVVKGLVLEVRQPIPSSCTRIFGSRTDPSLIFLTKSLRCIPFAGGSHPREG